MLNIALVNQWYPPYSYGGVAQYNNYLAEGLVNNGHKVFVISSSSEGFEQNFDSNGVLIHRVTFPKIPRLLKKIPFVNKHTRFLRNLLYSRRVCKCLRKLSIKNHIDIVEYAEINGEGFFHRKFIPILPYVIRCHTPYYLLEKTYEPHDIDFSCFFLNWMEKKMIQRASGITAPSRDLAHKIEKWCDLPEKTVEPIANLIDTDWFYPDLKYNMGGTIYVLYVGRIERAKGIYVLADAIKKVIKQQKNLKFYFAGKARSKEKLKEFKDYIYDLKISNFCQFEGEVSKEKLRYLYQNCDIFVNPSIIYESFSYTNAEAMACGKPVITSDIGGMPETVGHKIGGLVFRTNDSGDLSQKLILLIKSSELRKKLGKNARKRALNFSMDVVPKDISKFYKKVVLNYSQTLITKNLIKSYEK